MTFLRYIVLPVICLLWWAGTATAATVDSAFASANGDSPGSDWTPSTIDSALWQCVNEVAANDNDYWKVGNATHRTSFVELDVDTNFPGTEVFDSLRVLVRGAATTGIKKNIDLRYDYAGDVVFDTMSLNGNSNFSTHTSKVLTGLTNSNLDDLQIGSFNIDEPELFEEIQVTWLFIEIFTSEAGAVSPRRRRVLLEASK